MSSDYALQVAVLAALSANTAVTDIVGDAIYDNVPSDADFPRITFGPSDLVPDDAECLEGEEVSLQVDCWSRDNGKLHPCRTLVGAVKKAIHEKPLTLPDPYALNEVRVTLARVFRDPDEITAHGVVTVTALIEEPES